MTNRVRWRWIVFRIAVALAIAVALFAAVGAPFGPHPVLDRVTLGAALLLLLVALAEALWLRRIMLLRERHRARFLSGLVAAGTQAESSVTATRSFLAQLSHEIRTPLNGVLGMIELALQGDLQPEQREYLQAAQRSSDALLAVLDDVLDFFRIERGTLELERASFDLAATVEEAVRAAARTVRERKLELMCEFAAAVPGYVVGDRRRLHRILLHLLRNAMQATRQGEVLLRVTVRSADAAGIVLAFSVRDTGEGLPPERLGGLFRLQLPRRTDARRAGGAGLGLPLSAALVNLMHGRLTGASVPGQGSTFQFTRFGHAAAGLPLAAELATPAPRRALIVDDNRTNRFILLRMLANLGIPAEEVPDAPSALALLRDRVASGRPFSLLLTDLQMPGMDGFALIDEIRKDAILSDLSVILLVSDPEQADFDRCCRLRIQHCLPKPVRLRALREALLPRARGAAAAVAPPASPRRALRVLLVEDDVVNQKVARAMLEKMGHSVALASDGAAAVRQAGASPYDLILMDVQLPYLDGLEAAAEIRRFDARVPIVAMTAYALKGDRERCLAAGMNGYISKPVAHGELADALARFCGGVPAPASRPAPPAFDQNELMERLGQDAGLLSEMLALFRSDARRKLEELASALAARDAEGFTRAAHCVKGMLSTLAAHRASVLAERLESHGRAGDLSAASALLPQLERELGTLDDELSVLA